MPKQNSNENNIINSSDNTNKLQNQESTEKKPEEQKNIEKIVNFFKSLGETILNGIEWIKAYEREMISNKRKPGKWIMVKPPERIYKSPLEIKEQIINDIKKEKFKQTKENLSTIPEESQSLEESTEIDSRDRSDSQDMKTRVNPKYIRKRNNEIQNIGGTKEYLDELDEIRETMKNPPKTPEQQTNPLNKPKQGLQL